MCYYQQCDYTAARSDCMKALRSDASYWTRCAKLGLVIVQCVDCGRSVLRNINVAQYTKMHCQMVAFYNVVMCSSLVCLCLAFPDATYMHKSFRPIKKMTERINLTMKKWTKCNQNNTHCTSVQCLS